MYAEPVKKLLFVCTGNLCRSPAAETMFNALAREAGLDWHAESAGLSAVEGEPATEDMRSALSEVGFSADAHRSRRTERRIVEQADLILTMTPRQRERLHALLAGKSDAANLYTLPEYLGESASSGIPDPLGYPLSTYRASVRQIYKYVEALAKRLGD